MGFIESVRGLFTKQEKTIVAAEPPRPVVGAELMDGVETIQTFTNQNITFNGSLVGYDYTQILRDKQQNINRLFELSDYFVDADPIYRGIIKHVYAPYASVTPYKLIGGTESQRKKYSDYYDKIRLEEKRKSIMYQYFKYYNVYIYWLDGDIITLPPHLCRIGGMAMNGDPLVEFNAASVRDSFASATNAGKKFVDDQNTEKLLKGFPEEVRKAVKSGQEWVQMNPENTFVMQGFKEDWIKYSVPLIASILPPLARKALIGAYEDSMLNLGARGIMHVKYGVDRGHDYLVSGNELAETQKIFKRAMSGFPLAVTNQLVEAQYIQSDMQDLFQFDKYRDVNSDILSGGGVSGVIVTGSSKDGATFSSAQVSMKTVATRIQQALDTFAEIMNKINQRVNGDEKGVSRTRNSAVPTFIFMPFDMDGRNALEKACLDLWKEGVVSTQTMLLTHGYDIEEESARRKKEKEEGTEELMLPRASTKNSQQEDPLAEDERGRPEMTEDERSSDQESAIRSKQPKPSSPEGSLDESG